MNDTVKVLSMHFVRKWEEMFGEKPLLSEIQQAVEEGIRVQGAMSLYKANGNPFQLFAIYWNHRKGLVVKVNKLGEAVSFLSAERNDPMTK